MVVVGFAEKICRVRRRVKRYTFFFSVATSNATSKRGERVVKDCYSACDENGYGDKKIKKLADQSEFGCEGP